MPVAIQLVFPGGTTDQYDEVIQKMGFEPGGVANDDAYFHWVTKTDDGLLVTDVWESQEAFDKFAQEQIGPYSAEVGLPEPEVTTYPVHNYLIGGRVAS